MIENIKSIDIEQIVQSDPAGLDSAFQTNIVPELNRLQDINSLVALSRKSVELLNSKKSNLSVAEKWASIRDCGILIGSLIRNGVDPLREVEGLKNLTSGMGAETEMPPYHTVFHYSTLNPTGERERSFTGSIQERTFINQVRVGMETFMDSANQLFPIFTGDVDLKSPEAREMIEKASSNMDVGISTIPKVMKEVGAEYFAKEMRPFFDPLKLDGVVYDAPGGAQMPLLAIDHVLWASDTTESDYIQFRNQNMKYLPSFLRKNIEDSIGRPSIKNQVISFGLTGQPIGRSLEQMVTRLLSFRKAHGKLAKESFTYRDTGALGSGGATPDLLDRLSKLTKDQKEEL